MSLIAYELTSSKDRLSYEFCSLGPRGRIKKVVQFTKLDTGENIYNLGFGDVDEKTGEVDDLTVSNNNDTAKVLQTVASSVKVFFEAHPQALIAFQGSTEARMRLYINAMSRYFDDLHQTFEMVGFNGEGWESFRKNGHYRVILVTQRKH